MLSSLLSLPTELQELILSHIPHPASLLALSLTCQSFHQLIVPDHLCYRHITLFDYTTGRARRLWQHLISSPVLARHVRLIRLGIDNGRGLKVPADRLRVIESELPHVDPAKPARVNREDLTKALKVMLGLRSFTWRTPEDDLFINDNLLWDELTHSALFVLDVDVWVGLAPVTDNISLMEPVTSVIGLPTANLRRLTLQLYMPVDTADDYKQFVDSLGHFLRSCHAVQTLELNFPSHDWFDKSPIFTNLQFPSLRRLVFGTVFVNSPTATNCLHAHPQLELLRLYDCNFDLSLTHPGTFDCLRSFGPVCSEYDADLQRIRAPLVEEHAISKQDERRLRNILKSGTIATWPVPFVRRYSIYNVTFLESNYPAELAEGIMAVNESTSAWKTEEF